MESGKKIVELYLIRHLKTKGNLEGRYIGTTDEPLVKNEEQGQNIRKLRKHLPAHVDMVAASPLKRCMETAELLYPGILVRQYAGLRECDFGLFENRNYEELKEEPEYIRWLDSRGTLPFPGGESHEAFCDRCAEAFEEAVDALLEETTGALPDGRSDSPPEEAADTLPAGRSDSPPEEASGVSPAGRSDSLPEEAAGALPDGTVNTPSGERNTCAVLIMHGGTMMAVLERFDPQKREFYHWQTGNGCGFRVLLEEEDWRSGKQFREITEIG